MFVRRRKLIFASVTVLALMICVLVLVFARAKQLENQPLEDADVFTGSAPVLPDIKPQGEVKNYFIPILMYHYVEHVRDPGDTIRQKLDIFPETLDKQLQTMQDAGYTFLYASEVADILDGKAQLPQKPVVLTFDDGYRDFYTDALPILIKHKTKATAYIISGFLGRSNYMTVKQLLAVRDSGIVEIGAHTMHHIDLQHASDAKAKSEILGSKTDLETMLGIKITSFAYPGGRFNPNTVEIVKAAGFTNSVSTLFGSKQSIANRLILFRLRPGGRTGKTLLNFLESMSK